LLHGKQPATGMVLMAHEEANLRRAATLAFQQNQRRAGGGMADTLRVYLERAGRLRERDGLTAWAKTQLTTDGGLDNAACAAIRQHAWTRFTQGQAAEAIADVQNLIAHLEQDGLSDGSNPTFQLASGHLYLGRIYYHAGRSDLAVAPLQQAISLFEQLEEQGNLSATLGDLANAYRHLGQLDNALQTAERGLTIDRDLGRERAIVAGLARIAQILMAQNRYEAAEGRYAEALAAARQAGDAELEGITLQHMGSLHDNQKQYDQAVARYRQALTRFQQIGDAEGEMQTCDLLA
ncbi:MAG: tetratricopeptide repeat protein, partial [Alphaproteobacteria bacterium]|nr:tetratricopeptide repeat protein [Alphaproteobacteria bacterium]